MAEKPIKVVDKWAGLPNSIKLEKDIEDPVLKKCICKTNLLYYKCKRCTSRFQNGVSRICPVHPNFHVDEVERCPNCQAPTNCLNLF